MPLSVSFSGLPPDFATPTIETLGPSDIIFPQTSSASSATFTGREDYPVWPNGVYLSKFAHSPSDDAGLTDLDLQLYDWCESPSRPHYTKRDATATTDTQTPRPTYQADLAPCRRQAAININCIWENTNRTFSGLLIPTSPEALKAQQNCYCNIYPFFDSVKGCQTCFQKHGGIEGFHWWPSQFLNAFQSSYCAQPTITTDFYALASAWAKTQTDAQVATTTASNELGTSTVMSLYYTYDLAATAGSSSSTSTASRSITAGRFSLIGLLVVATFVGSMLSN